jgi:hypothetical protein
MQGKNVGFPCLDFQRWETSDAGMEENKNPLVEVHRLPGPQQLGTGATRQIPIQGKNVGFPCLDFQSWETSDAGIEENKNPLVEVHRLSGP